MDVVRLESPRNAVARVNPDFIRKKRQSLTSFVATLSSHGSVPLIRSRSRSRPPRLRNNQDGEHQCPTQKRGKPNRSGKEKLRVSSKIFR